MVKYYRYVSYKLVGLKQNDRFESLSKVILASNVEPLRSGCWTAFCSHTIFKLRRCKDVSTY